jgi:hypothetical protein
VNNSLRQASGKAVEEEFELPNAIVEKKEGAPFQEASLLQCGRDFFAKFNRAEEALLEQELKEKDFVGSRNPSRRDWAPCVPYELGGTKAFYPDSSLCVKKERTLTSTSLSLTMTLGPILGRKPRALQFLQMTMASSVGDCSSPERRRENSSGHE